MKTFIIHTRVINSALRPDEIGCTLIHFTMYRKMRVEDIVRR